MTTWMLWSTIVSALLAAASVAGERVAGHLGAPRRIVWMGAMLLAVIVSIAIELRPAQIVSTPAQSVVLSSAIVSTTTDVAPPPSATASAALRERPSIRASVVAGRLIEWSDRWIARAWLLASLGWLVFLVRSVLLLRRHRARWTEATLDACRVFVAPDVGPAVVGVRRPRIVVPRWALDIDRSSRNLLLRHELEHVRAGDTRVLFAAALARIVFPWNGALWWMTRRLRLAIEIDCDNRVIRAGGGAHSYGVMLLAVGERHAMRLPMSPALSEGRSFLETRIDVMTTPRPRRPLAASLPYAGIALVVLSAAAWTPLPPRAIRAIQVVVAPAPQLVSPLVASTPTPSAPTQLQNPVVRSIPRVTKPVVEEPPVIVPMAATAADPKPLPGNRPPRYPDSLKTIRAEGTVTVKFSSNAGGIPDSSTISVLSSTHPLFANAVRHILPSWRFDAGGVVRMAFQFITLDTDKRSELLANAPPMTVDGATVLPVVIVAAVSFTAPRRPPSESSASSTPAQRAFDVFLQAFNSADTLQFRKYILEHLPVAFREGIMSIRQETGGYDLLFVGRVEELNLDFAARERRTGETVGGFFALKDSDTTQLGMLRAFYAQGRSFAEAAQRARNYTPRP